MSVSAVTDASYRPLDGVRVVELTSLGPVPFVGTFLQDLGAAVTQVNPIPPRFAFLPRATDPFTAGKEQVDMDLKDPRGRESLIARVAEADVLLEGFRPGALERLQLAPEVLWRTNRSLVICRITGWGQDGPYAQRAGHDLNYIGVSGALRAIGTRDGFPPVSASILGDYAGGAMYALVGILSALGTTRLGGPGVVVDAAMVDGSAHLLSGVMAMVEHGRWGNPSGSNYSDGGSPFYNVYETADGKFVSATPLEPHHWEKFVTVIGLAESVGTQLPDESAWSDIKEQVAEAIRGRTRDEWTEIFSTVDACVAPVLEMREARVDPHVRSRGSVLATADSLRPSPAPRFTSRPADP